MRVIAAVKDAAARCLPPADDDPVTGAGQRDIEKPVLLLAVPLACRVTGALDKIRTRRPGRPIDKATIRVPHQLIADGHRFQHVGQDDHRCLQALGAMNRHHPHLIRGGTVHVTAHLATAATQLGKERCQRHAAAGAETLRQSEKMVERFIHRRAEPPPELLPRLGQHRAVEGEDRPIPYKGLEVAHPVGGLSHGAGGAGMCHQPAVQAAPATVMGKLEQGILIETEQR